MRVPPVGNDLRLWADDLRRYLARRLDRLTFKDASATPSENGAILWDDVNGYPVVSKGDEWRQIVLADGYAYLIQDNDVTAAASSTAYPIVFDAPTLVDGISLGASPNQSRIIFEEGGLYYLNFTAQIYSTSGSQVDFWFWPRINGTDIPSGATRASLHDNMATKPVTKGAVFSVTAGQYLEAMWATDNHTNSSLKAFAATAFAPAAPSVTLAIARLQA